MPTWDPKQYLRFEQERTRPCVDLVNRIDAPDVRFAVDLGCGPGNSTQVLARRFPDATVVGIDSSRQMVERARADAPNLRFDVADAAAWTSDRPCDVILSNACFQWLGHHDQLFPRLVAQLRAGGQLAVQMPRNFESPVHQILRSLATSPPFSAKLDRREPYWVREPGFYYDVLRPLCAHVDLWETSYVHVLDGQDAIIEWYKGTGMRPYLEPLDPAEREQFIDRCREQLLRAYPKQPDGRVLFPFPRIFMTATR